MLHHRTRAALVLAALIAIAYGGVLRNGFVFDDAIFVERDDRLQSLEGVRRLFVEPLWGFTDKHGKRGTHQYYRPLQLVAPAASKMLFGGAAWPVHLLSLILHLGCALLVYELLYQLSTAAASPPHRSKPPPVSTPDSPEALMHAPVAAASATAVSASAALVLSAMFAVHPANSEAVLWASDLAGLGATACMLAAVLVHARGPDALGPVLVAALSLGAMLFKESGVLVPLLMGLYDALIRERPRLNRRTIANYAAVGAALLVYLALRNHALGGLLPGAEALELGPAELLLNAVALVPSYVATFLWPFDLNMYRDFHLAHGLTDPPVMLGAVAILVGLLAAIACRRRRTIVLGLAWSAVTAAPWLVVRWPQLNAFAERYLYLPSIGIYVALLVPALAVRLQGATITRAVGLAVAGLIAACVTRDVVRTRDWRDEVTIYTKTLTQSPRAELIRNNLALRYLQLGKPEIGIPIQEELLRIDSDFPSGWHNLGLLRLATGQNEKAREAFEKAATLEPGNAATALNLGYVYDLDGQREKAVAQYFIAVMLDPVDTKAWYNLAVIAYEHAQLSNATRAVNEVLSRAPNDVAARTLQRRIGSRQPAPADQAKMRATARRCRDARKAAEQGQLREAVAKLQAAAWLDERSALPHHFLANLRYLNGATHEAYRHEREALTRDPHNKLYRSNVDALERALANAPSAGRPSFEASPAR